MWPPRCWALDAGCRSVAVHRFVAGPHPRPRRRERSVGWPRSVGWKPPGSCLKVYTKSAHTALAVKACLLGCKTATLNAQVTFVNIAVAIYISALAGGGPLKKFRTEPFLSWCFRIFWPIFGCCGLKGYWDGILGRFGGSWDILKWNFGSFRRVFEVHRTLPELVFSYFWTIFGCCGQRGYWDGILARFGGSWDILRCNFGSSCRVLGGIFKSFWVVFGCFFDDLA